MIGYLGPEGTFSQIAAKYYDNNIKPFKTINDVVIALTNNVVDEIIIPIENTTEGVVNATIDNLIDKENIFIQDMLVLPIHQNLMINKKNTDNNIEIIYSHVQGLAQSEKYLKKNYPNATLVPVTSTAQGAKLVSEDTENKLASVSPIAAADIYDIKLLDESIEDEKNNFTSFVKLGKEIAECPKNGYQNTICFSTNNESGELYKILAILDLWNINMTKIFSRPKKGEVGKYVFYIDLECKDNNDMNDALKMIERKTSFFKNLGVYKVNMYKE